MNVRVMTTKVVYDWADADVSWDTHTLQVVHGAETTTFPLANVISFTTSESGHPK